MVCSLQANSKCLLIRLIHMKWSCPHPKFSGTVTDSLPFVITGLLHSIQLGWQVMAPPEAILIGSVHVTERASI